MLSIKKEVKAAIIIDGAELEALTELLGFAETVVSNKGDISHSETMICGYDIMDLRVKLAKINPICDL